MNYTYVDIKFYSVKTSHQSYGSQKLLSKSFTDSDVCWKYEFVCKENDDTYLSNTNIMLTHVFSDKREILKTDNADTWLV